MQRPAPASSSGIGSGCQVGRERTGSLFCVEISLIFEILSLLNSMKNDTRVPAARAFLDFLANTDPKIPLFPCKIPLIAGKSDGDRCDQHCLASQLVQLMENFVFWLGKIRQLRAFRIGCGLRTAHPQTFAVKFPKVSDRPLRYSRFPEIWAGDWFDIDSASLIIVAQEMLATTMCVILGYVAGASSSSTAETICSLIVAASVWLVASAVRHHKR